MSWSYNGDPENDPVDEVRSMVGDTDTTDQLVSNEVILYVLTQFPKDGTQPPWLAAAHICDDIAGKFGRKAQRSVGSLSIAAQQQYDHYKDLADRFRLLWASQGLPTTGLGGVRAAAPVLGGGGRTYLGTNWYEDPEGL